MRRAREEKKSEVKPATMYKQCTQTFLEMGFADGFGGVSWVFSRMRMGMSEDDGYISTLTAAAAVADVVVAENKIDKISLCLF